MRASRIAAALCAVFIATSAKGWDGFGHMTVAAIAYDKLTPPVRKKVDKLLKLNPQYTSWVANVEPKNASRVAFVMAATWPDAIKSLHGYVNDGQRPNGPTASQNIGYSDKLQHRYWHYIDMPFSPDGTPLVQPVAPNAKTQIALFRDTLASASASDQVKSYDLAWLIHLVGDVHQPLHATSRFTSDLPGGDAGGNKVALCAKPCRDELHAFWDNVLGTSKTPSSAIKAASLISAASAAQAAVQDEQKWIDESFQAAQDSVYVKPVGIGAGPFTLDSKYRNAARKLAKDRVALAGARLAVLLNTALK